MGEILPWGPVGVPDGVVIWGWEVSAMEAAQGDRIIVHGRTVGATDRHGVILEVRGEGGAPPYVVRFDDGHETVMYPGGDFAVDRGSAG
ncbi:hypothetical protein NtRootA9_20430 [Arthrobacter sp. NtRootA9]|nr:hypothetical protein NtRootA9_20430 [Arthrobacter sp. NtRootA9]